MYKFTKLSLNKFINLKKKKKKVIHNEATKNVLQLDSFF